MYFNRFFLDDIVDFSVRLGADQGLFKPMMDKLRSNPDERVGYDVVVEFVKLAVEATKDDSFGLHLGEYFLLKATQPVDEIMQKSLTIEEAFSNAVAYSRLISDSMDCQLYEDAQGYFSVIFRNNPDWEIRSAQVRRHNLDAALVSTMKSLQCLTGFKYYPHKVKVPFKRPKMVHEYYRIFNCSLEYGHPFGEIQFNGDLLKKPISGSDYGLLKKLKRKAEDELRKPGEVDELLTEMKRAILVNIDGTQFPKQKEVAMAMNVTVRTLQRRLRDRKLKFSDVQTEIKLTIALRHLVEDGLQIDEIAYLLGYSESSAFVRAFKKWKGLSPINYVKRLKN